MSHLPDSEANNRQYARVDTRIDARIRPVSEESLPATERRIQSDPSVWAPAEETMLRKIANGTQGSTEALLAQSLLEVTKELVLLRSGLTPYPADCRPCCVIGISGGGGQLESPEQLVTGDFHELFLQADRSGVPPIRVLIQISASRPGSPASYGFRFASIHRRDKDRLIRHAFRLQRRALREAHEEKEGE